MTEEPWKSDQYFVSPWNYQPEVTAEFSPPAKLDVHDVTLRDGEQQAGIEFQPDEKFRIAERLAEAGVQRIEAGMPAVSPADAEAVRRIASAGLPARIFSFSRCMVDDVKRALDTGVEGIVMEIPSSEHIIQFAYRWAYERALELTIESTRFAHENGLMVSFFPIHSTRADITTFLIMIDVIARDALKTMYGRESGIDFSKLYGLSRLVREAARVPVPPNRGIVGDRLFHVESGIIASWVKNVGQEHLTEAFPFRPEMVGQTGPEIVLGKGSGLDSVLIWLDRLGLGPATEEQMQAILQEVKATSLKNKSLLDEDEFV